MLLLLACSLALAAPQQPPDSEEVARLAGEVRGLRQQVALLEKQLRDGLGQIDELSKNVDSVRSSLTELGRSLSDAGAAPFTAAPPPTSATAGVAKTVVFSPRVEADPVRRRDVVNLVVQRLDGGRFRPVGDASLASETAVTLPLDRSGALYLVAWSTPDGQTFDLVLRDGLTGQVAATVQVRPLQSQGHFIFVGY